MRTTVNIHDPLLDRARELAVKTRRPLGEVVDDALRTLFARMDEPHEPVTLTTFDGGEHGGVLPGVDIDSNEALRDLLDDPFRPPDETSGPGRAAG